jgi:hypothetical protein
MSRLVAAFLPVFVFTFSVAEAFAAEPGVQLDLAPVVKEGTPGDVLMEDPVASGVRSGVNPASSSGTLHRSLSEQLAVPVDGTGAPGTRVLLRGLGRSADATDVQALGIPLNPPQGGGFDLSIFPQFLWSSYEYRPGPALGTFDPRGTGGSLTLVPWTAWALGAGVEGSGRVAALGSSARLFQVSGATSRVMGDGSGVAVVVGSSSGDAQGPSAAVSGRWVLSPRRALSVHLLATDLDVRVPGKNESTPFARQRTIRGIPVVQLDSRVGGEGLLKSSVFFDRGYLKYENPEGATPYVSRDHSYQLGTEHALLWGAWKLGAGLRGVRYRSALQQDEHEDAVGHLLVSRVFEPGRGFLIEPVIRGVGVSRYGLLPEASLGARSELTQEMSVFARAGLSRRFPSLTDRFYVFPGFGGERGFKGNPALEPERSWTANGGVEWNLPKLRTGLEVYTQFTQSAQVRAQLDATTDTMGNRGNARQASLLGRMDLAPTGWLDLGARVTLSASRLDQTGLAFPGLPHALAVFSAGVHSEVKFVDGGYRWEARLWERISSSSVETNQADRAPAYHEESLELRARLGSRGEWTVIARGDDLLDRRPELLLGYPSFGRTGSVLVSRGW